jgi:C4-dicarboxylate-specific signal transduction histidine kinase
MKTGIFTLKKMARRMPEADQADYTDILADIENGLNRVAVIISELRGFTHPDQQRIDDVEVAAAIETALQFLSAEIGDRLQIVRSIPEGLTLRANRNRLVQVFLNLLENAVDATQEKQYPEGTNPEIRITGTAEGAITRVVIHDNGPGIPKGIHDKIFEPFFTTKDVGQGTGLGLSICHRLVSEMEGRIHVTSAHTEWSEFALEFPRSV